MKRSGLLKAFVGTTSLTLAVAIAGPIATAGASTGATAPTRPLLWAAQDRTGNVQLKGEVPLVVSRQTSSKAATPIGAVAPRSSISLNFGLPLRNTIAAQRAHRRGGARRTAR